jgi:putative selenium metabolism hydrolase
MTEALTPTVAVDDQALDNLLLRLISTPSLSTQEAAVAGLVAGELRDLGLEVSVDELGNVIGRRVYGPGPTVMIDCHLDTVPVVEAREWTHNPAGEIVGGRVYGRGAVDMKGPIAAVIHAISALGHQQSGTVVFAGTVAEELVEGPAAIHVATAVDPDFVVICEPSQRRIARGQRGRAEIVVEIEGLSSHSAYPGEGINAAEVMADVIAGLRELSPPSDDTLGEGILVLIDIKSEPYPSLSTVPERCRARFDRRTLVGESEADVLSPIRDVVAAVSERWKAQGTVVIAADGYTTYTGHRVQAQKFAPAWLFSATHPIVAGAVAGLQTAGLNAVVTHYRFCTNGSGTAGHLNIPTIGYGPGHEDQAHKVDEHIDLDDLHLGARGYAAILATLLNQDLKEAAR